MTEQPAANGAPSLRAGLWMGKFHGANAATGPTGSRTTSDQVPLARGRYPTVNAPRFLAVELKKIGRRLKLERCFAQQLSFFTGRVEGDIRPTLAQQFGGLDQHASARCRRCIAPDRKSTTCSIERTIKIGYVGKGELAQRFASGGINNPMRCATDGVQPFAIDVHPQYGIFDVARIRHQMKSISD